MQNSLERFIKAQEHDYQTALAEVRAGISAQVLRRQTGWKNFSDAKIK